MKRIVILTGDELRHEYFRLRLALDGRFTVVGSFCEGAEKGLSARISANPDASDLERAHAAGRAESERAFFAGAVETMDDHSHPKKIAKGAVNDADIVAQIKALAPDFLVCYGSSLIKSDLLEGFAGRFINVHLGLSPYYRGSGTNIWPMINDSLDMVGATFMHIDAGIDTGAVIHQIRADIKPGDGPHEIGNRLIEKMTGVYADLIARFDDLTPQPQSEAEGKLYRRADFDADACAKLYANFEGGMVERYLSALPSKELPPIAENPALTKKSEAA